MWSPSSIVLAFIALGSLSIAAVGTTTDQRCLEACSDYSGSLDFCRDAFDFKRESPFTSHFASSHADMDHVAQSQDIGFATEHIKCMCDGTRGDGNLGSEKMKASISTCLGCGITPNVIRDNLVVSTGFSVLARLEQTDE